MTYRRYNRFPDNPLCKRPKDSPMRRWCQCLKCQEYDHMRSTINRVLDLESGEEYQVEELLSAQFTAYNVDTGRVKFFFWKDKDVEWKRIEE